MSQVPAWSLIWMSALIALMAQLGIGIQAASLICQLFAFGGIWEGKQKKVLDTLILDVPGKDQTTSLSIFSSCRTRAASFTQCLCHSLYRISGRHSPRQVFTLGLFDSRRLRSLQDRPRCESPPNFQLRRDATQHQCQCRDSEQAVGLITSLNSLDLHFD